MPDPAGRGAPRPGDSLRTALWLALVPVVTLVVLPFLLLEIGPAYQARFGGGTPGTFVATAVECDDGTCRWVGDFVADEGGRLSGVRLIGDDVSAVGDSVPAVATGSAGAVYPAGGGSNWLVISGLLAVVVAALVLWGRALRRHVAARRRPSSAE